MQWLTRCNRSSIYEYPTKLSTRSRRPNKDSRAASEGAGVGMVNREVTIMALEEEATAVVVAVVAKDAVEADEGEAPEHGQCNTTQSLKGTRRGLSQPILQKPSQMNEYSKVGCVMAG
jgi:hypothetical protein